MKVGKHIKTVATATIGVVALIILIYGVQLPSTAMRLISIVPTLLLLAFTVFDKWAWRWKWVRPFVSRPWIGGTWVGTLTSYRRDADGQEVTSEHEVVLWVNQTLTELSVTFMSAESKSRSVAAEVVVNGKDDFSVVYQYDNTPQLEFRDKSPRHWGATAIDVEGLPVNLAGEYWTTRDSKGTFDVKLVSRSSVHSFSAGINLSPAEGDV